MGQASRSMGAGLAATVIGVGPEVVGRCEIHGLVGGAGRPNGWPGLGAVDRVAGREILGMAGPPRS